MDPPSLTSLPIFPILLPRPHNLATRHVMVQPELKDKE